MISLVLQVKLLGKPYPLKNQRIAPRYSDAEIRYLLKNRHRPWRAIPVLHAAPNMAEEDINAIICLPAVGWPAVSAADTTSVLPISMDRQGFYERTCKTTGYKSGVKLPTDNDQTKTGLYLVDNWAAFNCHSKSLTNWIILILTKPPVTWRVNEAERRKRYESKSSNITPDKNTVSVIHQGTIQEALTQGKLRTES